MPLSDARVHPRHLRSKLLRMCSVISPGTMQMGTMQMVHPHPASLPVSRPLQPRPPFNGTLPLATKPLRKVSSAADVDAAFRTDLLAMTRNLRAFALSLVGDQD